MHSDQADNPRSLNKKHLGREDMSSPYHMLQSGDLPLIYTALSHTVLLFYFHWRACVLGAVQRAWWKNYQRQCLFKGGIKPSAHLKGGSNGNSNKLRRGKCSIPHALLSAQEELRTPSQKQDCMFKRGMQCGEREGPTDALLHCPKCLLLAIVYPPEFIKNWAN